MPQGLQVRLLSELPFIFSQERTNMKPYKFQIGMQVRSKRTGITGIITDLTRSWDDEPVYVVNWTEYKVLLQWDEDDLERI